MADALTFFVVFLLSTTLHEAAHAWAAMRGGDPTAYQGGQVTLDPRPHIRRHPFGMIVFPVITAFATGWPMGFASAPYDPRWAERYPSRAALLSLAGPAANFLLVIIAAVLIRLGAVVDVFEAPGTLKFGHVVVSSAGPIWAGVGDLLGAFFSLNLAYGAFNLLPLPPLDGSGAVAIFMSPETARRYQQALWRTPGVALVGILVAWQLFGWVFAPLWGAAVDVLYPNVSYR